jgi:hypothetical protein
MTRKPTASQFIDGTWSDYEPARRKRCPCCRWQAIYARHKDGRYRVWCRNQCGDLDTGWQPSGDEAEREWATRIELWKAVSLRREKSPREYDGERQAIHDYDESNADAYWARLGAERALTDTRRHQSREQEMDDEDN